MLCIAPLGVYVCVCVFSYVCVCVCLCTFVCMYAIYIRAFVHVCIRACIIVSAWRQRRSHKVRENLVTAVALKILHTARCYLARTAPTGGA
jgi:hypothetical protein